MKVKVGKTWQDPMGKCLAGVCKGLVTAGECGCYDGDRKGYWGQNAGCPFIAASTPYAKPDLSYGGIHPLSQHPKASSK